MNKIIGVRFKRPGKVYFFDAGNIDVNVKDKVIVETAMGQEIGEVIINNKNLALNVFALFLYFFRLLHLLA